jgi:hypothetical protein
MTLKKMLNVPVDHELKQIRFKAKGGMAQNEYWTYAELDTEGNQVSKIEHWETMSGLKVKSGYQKYDMSGELVEEKLNLQFI